MGSPRKDQNTNEITKVIERACLCSGLETKVIYLCDLNFRGCRSCYQCMDDGKCKLPDDFKPIYDLIDKAAFVTIASPAHNYNVSSDIKGFLDRLFCYYEFYKGSWHSRLSGKNAIVVCVCAGASREDMGFTTEAILKTVGALEMKVLDTIEYFNTRKLPVVKNQEFLDQTFERIVEILGV